MSGLTADQADTAMLTLEAERDRCARLVMALGGPHRHFLAACVRDGTVPDKIEAKVARLAAEAAAKLEADPFEDLM